VAEVKINKIQNPRGALDRLLSNRQGVNNPNIKILNWLLTITQKDPKKVTSQTIFMKMKLTQSSWSGSPTRLNQIEKFKIQIIEGKLMMDYVTEDLVLSNIIELKMSTHNLKLRKKGFS
jgi:hypothetical protein